MTKPYTILWYVPNVQQLSQEIKRAVQAHRKRLNCLPNVVYVRPGYTDLEQINGLEVRTAGNVTPSHICVCFDPALPPIRQTHEPEPEPKPGYQQTTLF